MNLIKRLKLTKLLQNKKIRATEKYQGSRLWTFTLKTDDKEFISLLRELLGDRLKYEERKNGKSKNG